MFAHILRRCLIVAVAAGAAHCCHNEPDVKKQCRVDPPAAKADPPVAPARPRKPIESGATDASGQIALDHERVYFVTELDTLRNWEDSPSILVASPKSGGASTTLVSSATRFGPQISKVDDELFFARFGSFVPNPRACAVGQMCSQPRVIHGPTGEVAAWSSRGVRTLASHITSPGALAVDAADVFFMNERVLARVPRGGGPVTTLAKDVHCFALAVDASAVYCGGEGILAIPKKGGPPKSLSTDNLSGASLVLREALLAATSTVIPRACSKAEQGQSQGIPQCFDHDERIEWLRPRDRSTTVVLRIDWAEFLVADHDALYWTREGYLNQMPLIGGERGVRTPFGVDWPARGLALDDERIYWVTQHGHLGSAEK
jgi:hypothetical protein